MHKEVTNIQAITQCQKGLRSKQKLRGKTVNTGSTSKPIT